MGSGEGNITQRIETVHTILHSCTFIGLFGAFAKLRRETISFVISVCPSAWNNSAHIELTFMEFDMSIFRKTVEKIQVSLKSEKNNGYFT